MGLCNYELRYYRLAIQNFSEALTCLEENSKGKSNDIWKAKFYRSRAKARRMDQGYLAAIEDYNLSNMWASEARKLENVDPSEKQHKVRKDELPTYLLTQSQLRAKKAGERNHPTSSYYNSLPIFDAVYLKAELQKHKFKNETDKLCNSLGIGEEKLVTLFSGFLEKLNASRPEEVDPFFAKAGENPSDIPFMIEYLTTLEPFKKTSSYFLRNLFQKRLVFVAFLAPRSVFYWQWEVEPAAVYVLLEGDIQFYFMNEEQREDEADCDDDVEDECDSWEHCNSTKLENFEDATVFDGVDKPWSFSSRMSLGDRIDEDMETGQTFGNEAFRNMTVVTSKPTKVLVMPRAVLDHCQKLEEEMFFKNVLEFLYTVSIFSNVSTDSLEILCQKFQVYEFLENRIVLHEGDPLEGLFIILTGQCKVIRPDNSTESSSGLSGNGSASSLQSCGSETSSVGGQSLSKSYHVYQNENPTHSSSFMTLQLAVPSARLVIFTRRNIKKSPFYGITGHCLLALISVKDLRNVLIK
jgi:hypothetical protein